MVEEYDEAKSFEVNKPLEDEKLQLPLDPNLLNFHEQSMNNLYMKYLFFDKSGKKLSDGLYGNLLIFYLNLCLICACYLIFSVIAYSNNKMCWTHLIFHISWNITLVILSLSVLPLLKHPEFFVKHIRCIYLGISLLVYTYLIIGNAYVLNSISEADQSEYSLPMNIAVIAYSITLRHVLCHNFVGILLISTFLILEYIAASFGSDKAFNLSNFNEFFAVLFFVILQVIDTQHTEINLKKSFYIGLRNDRSYKTSISNRNEDLESNFHTETELLIQSCDKVKKTLKHACSIIFFKDIKEKLKLAQFEIEHIKNIISKSNCLKEVKVEPRPDMDPEDKEFISQNYLEISFGTPPERSSATEVTVFELKNHEKTFPFSNYGIEKLESVLSQLGKNWSFDIWFVYDTTGQSVGIAGKYLFEKWQLNEFLGVDKECSDGFFQRLEQGYEKNPYHNACHAADVLHAQLFFVMQSNLAKSLNQSDIVACIVAALGHDVGHKALTNRFLVNNRDKLAIRYNDSSVLENMHTAKTFKLLNTEDFNIFKNTLPEDWVKLRKIIIEMILETDMSKHFEILGKFKTRAQILSNIDASIFEDKCQILGMALKCADIGHSAKDYDLHEKWSMMVCEEFFRQGDIEKQRGQAISMYCDRENTDIPKSQAGFIKNICLPLYEIWCFYLQSETVSKFVLGQLKKNLEFWSEKKKRRATFKSTTKIIPKKFKKIQTSI